MIPGRSEAEEELSLPAKRRNAIADAFLQVRGGGLNIRAQILQSGSLIASQARQIGTDRACFPLGTFPSGRLLFLLPAVHLRFR